MVDDANRTLIRLVKDKELLRERRIFMIQFFHSDEAWHNLEPLRPGGHMLGRSSFRSDHPAVQSVAEEHVKFEQEGEQLFVEEGQTINGVYRDVPPGQPVELVSGTRFQVGQHKIEFATADAGDLARPLVSSGSETFRSRALVPLAYLDFLGPDGCTCARVPLTKAEGTVIGRGEGKPCDIELTGDTSASRAHARVFARQGRFFLEDLRSLNGTFIRIPSRTLLRTGRAHDKSAIDVLLLGEILIRVVET